MRLKANRSDVPVVCPACGYEDDNPENMLQHWVEAKELDWDGDTVLVPVAKQVAKRVEVLSKPRLPKLDINELVKRYAGLGLILAIILVPEVRAVVRQAVSICFQVLFWSVFLLVCLSLAILVVVK